MSDKKTNGWAQVRQRLSDWSKPALVAFVKDLYEASADNRDFIHARFDAEEGGAALEKYRCKIVEQFFPARGCGKLKLGEARKAIRDYRKATGNLPGTIELMLTYVETGTEFTRNFGGVNESFYNSLESVLIEMVELLIREGAELYPHFQERIQRLPPRADGIGWGYGDVLRYQVQHVENKLRGR